jgi:2,3-bisphosphoglycerate-dependent phosphoglycerate mutase
MDDRGWWNRPYETRPERRARARNFLVDLLEKHGGTDHRVAVFSHGGFYNHFLAALLNLVDRDAQPSQAASEAMRGENVILSAETETWFVLNNVAITRIDFAPEEVRLIYQNRVDFLPRGLIT